MNRYSWFEITSSSDSLVERYIALAHPIDDRRPVVASRLSEPELYPLVYCPLAAVRRVFALSTRPMGRPGRGGRAQGGAYEEAGWGVSTAPQAFGCEVTGGRVGRRGGPAGAPESRGGGIDHVGPPCGPAEQSRTAQAASRVLPTFFNLRLGRGRASCC